MSMTRLSSDGSLPNRNWKVAAAQIDVPGVQKQLLQGQTKPVPVLKAVIWAHTGNAAAGTLSFSANIEDTWVNLAPGDQYAVEAAPGHTFDLARLYIVSSSADDEFQVLYQPA